MATMGIIFSVSDYDEVSDEDTEIFNEFFDSMNLGIDDPVVDKVTLGSLM